MTSHRLVRYHFSSLGDDLAAARRAWEAPFKGNGHLLLESCITSMNKSRGNDRFQSFAPIIQSSGMGKSRVVDEVAKNIFTIPLNLRSENDKTGYPFSNTRVANFFAFDRKKILLHDEAVIQFLCFFEVLFEEILEKVVNLPSADPGNFAGAWRKELQNQYELYNKVVKSAYKKFSERIPSVQTAFFLDGSKSEIDSVLAVLDDVLAISEERTRQSALKLLEAISKKTGSQLEDRSKVLLLIYFDEAHCLHDVTFTRIFGRYIRNTEECTAYYSLASALDELRELNIFSLFLSTDPSLGRFTPTQQFMRRARSYNICWNLQPPFTELSFDVHTPEEPLAIEGRDTLNDVCEIKFMSRFGRPLFSSMAETGASGDEIIRLAKFKLLFGRDLTPTGELAALSTRLLLDFEPRREEASIMESELVMSHMRVIFSIPEHRYYMHTGTPSEPVLAEAASRAMFTGHESWTPSCDKLRLMGKDYRERVIAVLFKWLMARGLLEKGSLGELVARTLLTLAHDLAIEDIYCSSDRPWNMSTTFSKPIPVIGFIQALFRKEHASKILASYPDNVSKGVKFEESFKNAYVHFTHFGRTETADVLRDGYALAGMFRGMGWAFHRTQHGVDIGIPVFLDEPGKPLVSHKMTMIFFQVRNTLDPEKQEIDMESPELDFFSAPPNGQPDTRPYITIVLNLGIRCSHKRNTTSPGPRNSSLSTSALFQTPDMPQESEYNPDNTSPKLFTGSSEPDLMKQTHRGGPRHPRYSVSAYGCTHTVYRVIDGIEPRYARLLRSRDIISEHDREGKAFLDAIENLKPYWERGGSSFGWLRCSTGSPFDQDQDETITTRSDEGPVDDAGVDVGLFREVEDE